MGVRGSGIPAGSIKNVGQRKGIVETEQIQTQPKTSIGFWRQLLLTLADVQIDQQHQHQ